jgi:conjugal transfer pilin signal peptidase TrbI
MRLGKPVLYVLMAIGLVAVIIGVEVTVQRYTTPTFVSVDLRGTIDAFTKQSGEQQLSDAQREALAARFSQALDASLVEYQTSHRAIVLLKAAVIAGAPDITAQIQRDVADKMRPAGQP